MTECVSAPKFPCRLASSPDVMVCAGWASGVFRAPGRPPPQDGRLSGKRKGPEGCPPSEGRTHGPPSASQREGPRQGHMGRHLDLGLLSRRSCGSQRSVIRAAQAPAHCYSCSGSHSGFRKWGRLTKSYKHGYQGAAGREIREGALGNLFFSVDEDDCVTCCNGRQRDQPVKGLHIIRITWERLMGAWGRQPTLNEKGNTAPS